MFGRVRASPSSLDSLERPPSKLFKDDPLSIYETTLIKLKLGSQRDLSSPSPPASEEAVEEMESDCSTTTALVSVSTSNCMELPSFSTGTNVFHHLDGESMAIDTCSSSANASQSKDDSKQPRSRTMPLLYLFSKYNTSHQLTSESDRELRSVVSFGSATTSPSTSNSHSSASTQEHECHASFSE